MLFYTPSRVPRPVRLSEATRRFAEESLNHKYGLDTRKTPAISLDDVEDWEAMSPIGKFRAAEDAIVRRAPIRICGGELVSGAATLGNAIDHRIPVTYHGEHFVYSVSHITLAFYNVLAHGTDWYRERILRNLPGKDDRGRELLEAMLNTLDNIELWHERYMTELARLAETDKRYEENMRHLKNVPMRPASNFREGVQSL